VLRSAVCQHLCRHGRVFRRQPSRCSTRSRCTSGTGGCRGCFHTARKGAAWGAIGGAVVGLIFPPTLLAGALVGAGAGLGIGGLVSHGEKAEIKADVGVQRPR
jgi:hypothetical protein